MSDLLKRYYVGVAHREYLLCRAPTHTYARIVTDNIQSSHSCVEAPIHTHARIATNLSCNNDIESKLQFVHTHTLLHHTNGETRRIDQAPIHTYARIVTYIPIGNFDNGKAPIHTYARIVTV
jgi:hypothetical protein